MPFPRFEKEQNVFSFGNFRYTLGSCYSTELGKDVRYARNDGRWVDPFKYEQIYKLSMNNNENKELYQDFKENDDKVGMNAMRNTFAYWQVGANIYNIEELRPERMKDNGNVDFGLFSIPTPSYDSSGISDLGINLNLSAGIKTPLHILPSKMTHKHRKLHMKNMSPDTLNNDWNFIEVPKDWHTPRTSYTTVCGEQHPVNNQIEYNTLMNTQVGGDFAMPRSEIEYNAFAPARYIKDRGIVVQEYSTIGMKESETNPVPDDVKYIKGKTKKYNHEEVISDRREEYSTLVQKLKDAGISDPDQFIKDYTDLAFVPYANAELAIIEYMKNKTGNFDVMKNIPELLVKKIETPASLGNIVINDIQTLQTNETSEISPDEGTETKPDEVPVTDLTAETAKNEQNTETIFSVDVNEYLKNNFNNSTESNNNINGKMGLLENSVQFESDATVQLPSEQSDEQPDETEQLFNKMLEQLCPDLIKAVEDKRRQMKDKYNVDIYDLNLNAKEYEALTRAFEIYEYSPEEIAKIRAKRGQLSNRIYNNYVRIAKETQDNGEIREWQTRESFEKFGEWVQNRFADFYNSQLNGTFYTDLSAGVDADFALSRGELAPMGYVWGQAGVGYANDFWDLSGGVRVQKGNYQIGNDKIELPAYNPYVQLEVDCSAFGVGKRPDNDFEKFQHKNKWSGVLRYEPLTKTVTAGFNVNLTPKQMKQK